MQSRTFVLIAVSVFLLMSIGWAGTAVAEPEDRSGLYVGIGPGFGFENFDGIGGLDVDAAFGFDGWGGYQFNEWVAVELQLEYLNGFDVGSFVDGQAVTFGGNLKVFPLASVLERIQPFVYAGPGFTWVDFDAGGFGDFDALDFSARFGGGIDFYITESLALQASSSYVLTTGDVDDLDYISLVTGIQYKF